MEYFNAKHNLSGDIISKTYIWKAAILKVKGELVKQNYKNITFNGYLNLSSAVNSIVDGKYEVSETAIMSDVNSNLITKNFSVIVNIIGQGVDNINCKVERVTITD